MDIDEAIKRHKAMATEGNVIFSNNPDLAEKHNKEHEQIVEWLEELKWYWSMLKRCRSFTLFVEKQNQPIKKCEHTFASCHHTELKCSECPVTELLGEEFSNVIVRCYEDFYTAGVYAGSAFGRYEELEHIKRKNHEASEEAKREEFITGRKKHNEKVVRMSNRPQITAILSLSILKHICPNNDPRIYWAKEVTFDWATSHSVRVDFMKFKPVNNTVSGIEKGDFYCYEVKSSVDDFHSKNGHNFIGDYNYYVMPEEVYEQIKQEIPYRVGVYVPAGMNYQGEWYDLKAIKKAKRQDRNRPVSEMLLMMFRSAARERSSNGEINKDL